MLLFVGKIKGLAEHVFARAHRMVYAAPGDLWLGFAGAGLTQMPLPKASGVRVCIGLSGAFFTFGGRKWRKCNK
jgi:hypothetical protein